jgi:hypothetical protein
VSARSEFSRHPNEDSTGNADRCRAEARKAFLRGLDSRSLLVSSAMRKSRLGRFSDARRATRGARDPSRPSVPLSICPSVPLSLPPSRPSLPLLPPPRSPFQVVNHPFIVKMHFAFKTHDQVPPAAYPCPVASRLSASCVTRDHLYARARCTKPGRMSRAARRISSRAFRCFNVFKVEGRGVADIGGKWGG